MSSVSESAIVPYQASGKMVKSGSKPGRASCRTSRNATQKKRKTDIDDLAVVHEEETRNKRKTCTEDAVVVGEEESPTSVVDSPHRGSSAEMEPRRLLTDGSDVEKDVYQNKQIEGKQEQCFVVGVGGENHFFSSLEAAFGFKQKHGSSTDGIAVYESIEEAEESIKSKKVSSNDGTTKDEKSSVVAPGAAGLYDFTGIDDSSINLDSVADFRNRRDFGKFLALFNATSVIVSGDSKSVVVPFCIFEDNEKVFWAFKASKVKEALEYLCDKVASFSNLRSVVSSMRSF